MWEARGFAELDDTSHPWRRCSRTAAGGSRRPGGHECDGLPDARDQHVRVSTMTSRLDRAGSCSLGRRPDGMAGVIESQAFFFSAGFRFGAGVGRGVQDRRSRSLGLGLLLAGRLASGPSSRQASAHTVRFHQPKSVRGCLEQPTISSEFLMGSVRVWLARTGKPFEEFLIELVRLWSAKKEKTIKQDERLGGARAGGLPYSNGLLVVVLPAPSTRDRPHSPLEGQLV